MISSKITHKITQGMYVLTVAGGGCLVDAVARVGAQGDQPLVAVSVAKNNHSHKLLAENQKFALSVLGNNTNPEIITTFGFNSSRDTDKFAKVKTREINGVKILSDSIGYMVMEKTDAIDNETHTVYIGKVVAGELFQPEAEPMTYAYYQEHKDNLTKVTTEQGKTAWICTACGYIYYGDEVPDDYICPLCGLGKSYFKKKES